MSYPLTARKYSQGIQSSSNSKALQNLLNLNKAINDDDNELFNKSFSQKKGRTSLGATMP